MYASRVIGELSAPRGDRDGRRGNSHENDNRRNNTRRSRSRRSNSHNW
jgi:hypothetical protein